MELLTIKVGVDTILQIGAGTKVDEPEVEGLEVDKDVLILDVPVDDALVVAGKNRLHNLSEEVARKLQGDKNTGWCLFGPIVCSLAPEKEINLLFLLLSRRKVSFPPK